MLASPVRRFWRPAATHFLPVICCPATHLHQRETDAQTSAVPANVAPEASAYSEVYAPALLICLDCEGYLAAVTEDHLAPAEEDWAQAKVRNIARAKLTLASLVYACRGSHGQCSMTQHPGQHRLEHWHAESVYCCLTTLL